MHWCYRFISWCVQPRCSELELALHIGGWQMCGWRNKKGETTVTINSHYNNPSMKFSQLYIYTTYSTWRLLSDYESLYTHLLQTTLADWSGGRCRDLSRHFHPRPGVLISRLQKDRATSLCGQGRQRALSGTIRRGAGNVKTGGRGKQV